MKKSVIILSTMTLFVFTSCNNKNDKVESTDAIETTDTVETTDSEELLEDENQVVKEDTTTAVNNVVAPNFDNPELQEYMNSYDTYIEEYKEALNAQDTTTLQNLSAKGEELNNKAQAFTDLSKSDQKKLAEYIQKQTKELQDIMMKAANE